MAESLIRRLAHELDLDRDLVAQAEAILPSPGQTDPATAILQSYRALASAACASGDHRAEASVARMLLDLAEGLASAVRAQAWLLLVEATSHEIHDAGRRVVHLHVLAAEAERDLVARFGEEELGPSSRRALLDPIMEIVLGAEVEAGVDPSGLTADLDRRKVARSRWIPSSPSFGERNLDGISALWAREGMAWFADRYRDRHGGEPPEGWWVDDPESPMGGRIHPESGHLFDAADRVDFIIEMEERYRVERGLPARGEGWVSQQALRTCVEEAVAGAEVISEARLPWLPGQRLDIYVPSLAVAFEHQGEQHFFPLDHWGGDQGLAARRDLDERKRDACARAGVRLIEWRYDEPISVEAVRERLRTGLGD